ncbi:hypothetical protein BJY01DRAFT_216242 [Aspergillus pseudoustus]|uniref:Uncharacterized protein n=1 Tax=Aspergillus pseudoustus TaxID=1810923 RepID=A0ABR4JSA3_9EURO
MWSSPITLLGLPLVVLLAHVLAQSAPPPDRGIINVFLFRDNWKVGTSCHDLVPVACLRSSGTVDTSRLHCGRFDSDNTGNLTNDKTARLSLFTGSSGQALLGTPLAAPISWWTEIGNNTDKIPRQFLRVDVPEWSISGGPRWYGDVGSPIRTGDWLATASTATSTNKQYGLCLVTLPP